jgi:hypothetical protein
MLVDRAVVTEPRDWQGLQLEIRKKSTDSSEPSLVRKLMSTMHMLPRTIVTLIAALSTSISPREAEFDVLWGLIHLNLKVG